MDRERTEGKRAKGRLTRKQIVRIEWAAIITVAALTIVALILILGRKADSDRRTDSSQKAENGQVTDSAQAADSAQKADSVQTADGVQGADSAQKADGVQTADGVQGADSGSGSDSLQQTASQPETLRPKETYLFSFAGDCTIGSLLEWQGSQENDFQSVVGENYAYPLSGVKEIFAADDLTAVNLEGTFTRSTNAVEKPYRFKGDPAYVRVLTEGSVEAVSLANNHSGDFREEGKQETVSTLDGAGILHTDAGAPLIQTMEGGLKIGIVSYNTVENYAGEMAWRTSVKEDIETCKSAGCSLIIGFMHWGTVEYLPEPEDWEVQFAHDMVDWGCGLIVGGHAHILQRMEYYNDVPIFYSMGNFCYGGNTNPDDKDSVIVQAEYSWADGKAERKNLKVIPCEISTRNDRNDYCPTICQEGSADYQRILEKLEWKG